MDGAKGGSKAGRARARVPPPGPVPGRGVCSRGRTRQRGPRLQRAPRDRPTLHRTARLERFLVPVRNSPTTPGRRRDRGNCLVPRTSPGPVAGGWSESGRFLLDDSGDSDRIWGLGTGKGGEGRRVPLRNLSRGPGDVPLVGRVRDPPCQVTHPPPAPTTRPLPRASGR